MVRFSSFFIEIDRTLLCATSPVESGPIDGNEGVLCILPISSTVASSSDLFSVISGHSLGEFCYSAEIQSVYFTAPANLAIEVSMICHWNDSDSEAAVLEIWGVWSIASLTLYSHSLWLGVFVFIQVSPIV